MLAEEQRLLDLAIEQRINLRTRCQGNEIELCFEQWHDSVGFRRGAFGAQAHTGTYQHTIKFEDEAVIELWMIVAKEFLDHQGIEHTVDHHKASRCFDFTDMMAHAVFVEHAEDGFFDRLADQRRLDLAQQYQARMEQAVMKYRDQRPSSGQDQRLETGHPPKPLEPMR